MVDFGHATTVSVTADASIGTAGKIIRVWNANLVASSGGASSVVLRNGTTTGGTIFAQIDTSAASKGVSQEYGVKGLRFPSGCFVDVGSNVDGFTITYSEELA